MGTTVPTTLSSTTLHPSTARQPLAPEAPRIGRIAREALLQIARVGLQVATGRMPPEVLLDGLGKAAVPDVRAAVFVTLTEHGALRGCMGTLDPDQRVDEAVARTVISSARDDPRFFPVEESELPALRIDVSVLGPSVAMEDLSGFVPGRHGVIVERGARRALLLPEVATDQGWDATQMLEAVCRKAGLPPDAWRDPRTRRLIFATTRFGGPAVP
jgi:AmmeMemoRadiSam system protein A